MHPHPTPQVITYTLKIDVISICNISDHIDFGLYPPTCPDFLKELLNSI